jgi:hypothetical protein
VRLLALAASIALAVASIAAIPCAFVSAGDRTASVRAADDEGRSLPRAPWAASTSEDADDADDVDDGLDDLEDMIALPPARTASWTLCAAMACAWPRVAHGGPLGAHTDRTSRPPRAG